MKIEYENQYIPEKTNPLRIILIKYPYGTWGKGMLVCNSCLSNERKKNIFELVI